jgi:hypothetical protein
MQRNYRIGANERAALLACCCGWLDCDIPVGPAKETGDLVNKELPSGIAGDNLVAAAGELDVTGTPDSRGDKASFAGGNDGLGRSGKLRRLQSCFHLDG